MRIVIYASTFEDIRYFLTLFHTGVANLLNLCHEKYSLNAMMSSFRAMSEVGSPTVQVL